MSGAEVSQVGRAAYFGGRTEFVQISRAELLTRRALALPLYRVGGKLVRDGLTFRRLLMEAAVSRFEDSLMEAGEANLDFSAIKSGEVIDFGRITERRVFYDIETHRITERQIVYDISSSYPAAMLRKRP